MDVGTEYPTSNLFLPELWQIKEILDEKSMSGSSYMMEMARKMKLKFDKYWGECNLLISIAAVLDPRNKMKLIEFAFQSIYKEDDANRYVITVQNCLYELYKEYVDAHALATSSDNVESGIGVGSSSHISSGVGKGKSVLSGR